MKKILNILIAITILLTLCACEKEQKEIITMNTCTMTENTGTKMTYQMTATNDEIDKILLTMTPSNSIFNVESLNILDETKKEQVKTNMLNTLGLDSTTYEGININIEINENMVITIETDLKISDPEILKKLGMDFSNTNMSLEEAVKDMKDSGAICTN